MSVTPEFVKKELVKVEKKRQANETTRKEALESLDKTEAIKISLEREEVALRTLAAGVGVSKSARPGFAQQLAEVMGVKYDEASIMELISKYEKQDTTAESPKPAAAKAPKASTPKVDTPLATGDVPEEAPKRKGRPRLTDEEKAERARQRALAAAAAAAVPPVDEQDDEGEDDGEPYFDPDEYDNEE